MKAANTLWPTLLGGVNFVLHAAGWLEGGLSSGYEKFIIDADQLSMFQRFAAGSTLARTARRWTQFARSVRAAISWAARTPRPISRRRSGAPASPTTIPSSNGATSGCKDIAVRANEAWKRQLREYEAPPLDPAIDEQLLAFMTKRKAVLPDGVS